MKKNVGTIDALIRIAIGLAGLAYSTSKMIRHPHRTAPLLLAIIFGMKVAEGITRYCPMLDMMRTDTESMDEKGTCRIRRYARRLR